MKLNQIAFFDAKPYDRDSFVRTNGEFGFEIKFFAPHLNVDTVSLADGFLVVCAFVNDDLSAEVVERLYQQGTRLIALRCAGYNNVDLKAVYERIHVLRVPAYSPHAVAEHAAALMLTLNRKTHRAFYRTRDNNFNINGLLGFDMHGKTAGVIGTGKIGKVMIRILNGFGMQVQAYDLYPDEEFAREQGIGYRPLDDLLATSDIITLHCPLTRDTHHLINHGTISKMKQGVMIINTGRGQLLDTQALIEGLKQGKVGAAGLDVYEEESEYFFEDFSNSTLGDDVLARLLTFNNVLITSHQGFFTREALSNIARTTLENIRSYFTGGALQNEVCYRCEHEDCRKEKEGKCF